MSLSLDAIKSSQQNIGTAAKPATVDHSSSSNSSNSSSSNGSSNTRPAKRPRTKAKTTEGPKLVKTLKHFQKTQLFEVDPEERALIEQSGGCLAIYRNVMPVVQIARMIQGVLDKIQAAIIPLDEQSKTYIIHISTININNTAMLFTQIPIQTFVGVPNKFFFIDSKEFVKAIRQVQQDDICLFYIDQDCSKMTIQSIPSNLSYRRSIDIDLKQDKMNDLMVNPHMYNIRLSLNCESITNMIKENDKNGTLAIKVFTYEAASQKNPNEKTLFGKFSLSSQGDGPRSNVDYYSTCKVCDNSYEPDPDDTKEYPSKYLESDIQITSQHVDFLEIEEKYKKVYSGLFPASQLNSIITCSKADRVDLLLKEGDPLMLRFSFSVVNDMPFQCYFALCPQISEEEEEEDDAEEEN